MDFEELKNRYKYLPFWGRALIMATLGMIPALYIFVEEGEVLEQELANASQEVIAKTAELNGAKRKRANLPKLEEKLAFTEGQLQEAGKRLPDAIIIEEVLQKTASLAKETDVELKVFEPKKEVPIVKDEFEYFSRPVETRVLGHFQNVAQFLDRLVHLERAVSLRNWHLRAKTKEPQKSIKPVHKMTDFDRAVAARRNLRVEAEFHLTLYRSMSDTEAVEERAKGQKNDKKG